MPTRPEPLRCPRRRPARAARGLALGLALVASLASGCTLTRVYVGTPVRFELAEALRPGESGKGEVLRRLGAPDGIVRQFDGDIFVYRYERRNRATFRIQEPVITNLELFSYSRSEQKHDSIVVLFDEEGVVREVGTAAGTDELGAF